MRKINASKGSPEQFLSAAKAKLAELQGNVESASDVEDCNDIDTLNEVTASVAWSYYNNPEFDTINDKYLPDSGEGDSIATQCVTAVNKLIYKWYNDGDVYDNTHGLEGWCNDLSSYANWLHKYTPAANILEGIYTINTESEYEDLLKDVADMLLDEAWLAEWADVPAADSVYTCKGPFQFEEIRDDEYDDYDDYEDDDYEDDDYEDY